MNKILVIQYPGSNCQEETLHYFDNSVSVWHTETNLNVLENVSLVVIPGGFAFGDRVYDKATENYTVKPGIMAAKSPVTSIILEAHKQHIPILGICNGFQILIELGLLSGSLTLNKTKKYACKKVICELNDGSSSELYIANSYGNFQHLNSLDFNVFLHYKDKIQEYDSCVAGIYNNEKTVFGMMPHPERNNTDFKKYLYKLIFGESHPLYIQSYFKCRINEIMFSEHVSYKSTRRYLKNFPTWASHVIQGPGENAGIVDIGGEYAIAVRIESHNHPTFINPYEGAATGVGGILRDVFAMGARPIAILDFLRFGTDDNSNRLLNRAIDGISYYGNCVGVPNVGGDLYVDECYNKNPLVNVGCIGLVKKNNIIYGNAKNNNTVLIYVGSKTDSSGVGGAAMASKSFTDSPQQNNEELKKNIQKSDPFLEKLLLEACCEISSLYNCLDGMQDLGAGGLLCATLEVVLRGREKFPDKNMGCSLFLDKVPVKYDMDPCDILISESQERMLIVAKESECDRIFNVFNKWDLEYAEIGIINNTGIYDVYFNKKLLYKENIKSFNDIQDYTHNKRGMESHISTPIKIKDMNKWSQYDSTVGNRTLKGPDKPGSYSILDIHEINKKLFVTWGETFKECYDCMNQFEGVKPLCMVNCLNFGDPSDSMDDFILTVEELAKCCRDYNVPIVGGNVSLYNTTDDVSIRPTPVLMMLGIN